MELYAAYLRFFVAFPLVMILAWFGLRFLLPRFAPMLGMGRRIQVLERVALHSRAYLYVVKVGEDYFLLAAAPGSVTLLKDLGPDWAENSLLQETGCMAPRRPESLTRGSFASLLERLGYKGNNWKGPGGQG
ncbi:MAG: FliO/MopB family protein [Dethiobacteria bacterium]|jgi:flagellar biosynthetic protein FliO